MPSSVTLGVRSVALLLDQTLTKSPGSMRAFTNSLRSSSKESNIQDRQDEDKQGNYDGSESFKGPLEISNMLFINCKTSFGGYWAAVDRLFCVHKVLSD